MFQISNDGSDPFILASPEFAQMEFAESLTLLTMITEKRNLSLAVLPQSSFFEANDDVLLDYSVVYSNYNGLRGLHGVPCQYFQSKLSQLLWKLKPVSEVIEIVNELINTHFLGKLMVGVHIRMHSNEYDWSGNVVSCNVESCSRYNMHAIIKN